MFWVGYPGAPFAIREAPGPLFSILYDLSVTQVSQSQLSPISQFVNSLSYARCHSIEGTEITEKYAILNYDGERQSGR